MSAELGEQLFEQGLRAELQGDLEKAIELYRKATDSKSWEAALNLGTIEFKRGNIKTAIAYYELALDMNPNYALAYFNLGNAMEECHRDDDALRHYLRALEINPDHADTHFNIGLLYLRMGSDHDCIKHLEKYLQFDSGSQWAIDARKHLGQLYKFMFIRSMVLSTHQNETVQ